MKPKTKRDRAIKILRDTGMNDEEIGAYLVEHGLSANEPSFTVDSDGIIDAEIVEDVEPSNDGAIEGGLEPANPLPAVISRESDDSTKQKRRDWSKSAVPERRCRAHKKTGDQCGNAAIKGATVCRYHGGASKHVKLAARARLENASDRLAKELLGMAVDPNMTPQVKLAAIRDALDRGGLKTPTTVEIGPTKPHEEIFADIMTGGSRDAYRNGTDSIDGLDDSPGIESNQTDYGTTDYAHSDNQPANGLASWAKGDHTPHPATLADGDYGPVSGPPASEPRTGRQPQRADRSTRSQGPSAVTGEEAIRQANIANGLIDPDVYGLPPGRSHYR